MDGAGPDQTPSPSHAPRPATEPSPKTSTNPSGSVAPRFPDGFVLNSSWILKRRIGQGRYSDVYAAVSNDDDGGERRRVAIKVEKEDIPSEGRLLKWEATVLGDIQDCPYVCRMHESGVVDDGGFYIVMDLCSETLSECRKRQPGGQFRPHKGAAASISILNCIEALHRSGFVHRDIKPSNFVRPLKDSKNVPKSIMIDFGLARRHHRNGAVFAARPMAEFRGTSKYASLNSHFCKELGPRDDMFSFLFVLLDFVIGKLPWCGLSSRNEIASLKRKLFGRDFVRIDSIPEPIYQIADHLNTLRFQDNPDYNLVRNCVQELCSRRPSLSLTPARPHSPIRVIPEISEESSPMKRLIRPFCQSCLVQRLCEDLDCPLLHPPCRRAFVLSDAQPLPLCLDFIRGACRKAECHRHHWTETEEAVYLRTGCLPVRSSDGCLPILSLPTSSSIIDATIIAPPLTTSPMDESQPAPALNRRAEEPIDVEEPVADAAVSEVKAVQRGVKAVSPDEVALDLNAVSLDAKKPSAELSSESSREDGVPVPSASAADSDVDSNVDVQSADEVDGEWSKVALGDALQLPVDLNGVQSFEKVLMCSKQFNPLMALDDAFVSFEHVLWSAGILLEEDLSACRRAFHSKSSFAGAGSRARRSSVRTPRPSSAASLRSVTFSDSESEDSDAVAPLSRRRSTVEKPIIIRLKLARRYRSQRRRSHSSKKVDIGSESASRVSTVGRSASPAHSSLEHDRPASDPELQQRELPALDLEDAVLPPAEFQEPVVSESEELQEPALPDSELQEPALPESKLQEPAIPDSELQEPALPESELQEPALPDSELHETALPESELPDAMLVEVPELEDSVRPGSEDPESLHPDSPLQESVLQSACELEESVPPESDLQEPVLSECKLDEHVDLPLPQLDVPDPELSQAEHAEPELPESESEFQLCEMPKSPLPQAELKENGLSQPIVSDAELQKPDLPEAEFTEPQQRTEQPEEEMSPADQPEQDLPHAEQPEEDLPQVHQQEEDRLQNLQQEEDLPQDHQQEEDRLQDLQQEEDLPQDLQQEEDRPQDLQQEEDLPQDHQQEEDLPQDEQPEGDLPQPEEDLPQPEEGLPQDEQPEEDLPQPEEDLPQHEQPEEDLPQHEEDLPQHEQPEEDLPQHEEDLQDEQPEEDLPQPEEDLPQHEQPEEDRSQAELSDSEQPWEFSIADSQLPDPTLPESAPSPGGSSSSYCNPRITIRIKRTRRKVREVQDTLVVLRLKRSLLQLPFIPVPRQDDGSGARCTPPLPVFDFAPFLFDYLRQTKDQTPGLLIPDPAAVNRDEMCGESTQSHPTSSPSKVSRQSGAPEAVSASPSLDSRRSDRSSNGADRPEGQPREPSSVDADVSNGVAVRTCTAAPALNGTVELHWNPILIRIKRNLFSDSGARRKRPRLS